MIRVLLCDPSREEWLGARALLEDAGQTPISVGWEPTVVGASQAIRTGSYDVCLAKDTFSGGRWTELVNYVTATGQRIPVILLVTRPHDDRGVSAIREGAADVLVRGELSGPLLERAILHTVARSRQAGRSAEHPSIPPAEDPSVLRYRLDAALARARRGRGGVAVLTMHIAELVDAPLAHARPAIDIVARRLHSCLRQVDTVSQVGAEFVMLIEDEDAAAVAARVAHDLIEVMAEPIELRSMVLNITASIGIAAYPDDGEDAVDIFAAARAATHAATDAGGRQLCFHSRSLHERAERRLQLLQALDGALEREEFTLHYQPQVDMGSGSLVAVEALLRWHHQPLGQVPPAEFVPVLEGSGQIEAMEKWVVAEACGQARQWLDDGTPVRININLSARQFHERDVGSVIRNAIDTFELPPELLGLEVTEGLMVDSSDAVRNTFEELRSLGVLITVDDFGTEHSSLRFVKHYPMDMVKVDREFVSGLPLDESSAAITGAIVALSHSLGLTVVAEGIESPEQEQFLRSLGCHLGQGFYYARPMAASELAEWRTAREKDA
jgi:diguanylate cyclase (GGDEF)-like protein